MKITVNIKPFYARVTILIGEYDEIKRHIPKGCEGFDGGEYMARCASGQTTGGNPCFEAVIHSKSYAMSVLAHEVLHAVSDILSLMGETPVWSSEVQAYMLQYILGEIEERIEAE